MPDRGDEPVERPARMRPLDEHDVVTSVTEPTRALQRRRPGLDEQLHAIRQHDHESAEQRRHQAGRPTQRQPDGQGRPDAQHQPDGQDQPTSQTRANHQDAQPHGPRLRGGTQVPNPNPVSSNSTGPNTSTTRPGHAAPVDGTGRRYAEGDQSNGWIVMGGLSYQHADLETAIRPAFTPEEFEAEASRVERRRAEAERRAHAKRQAGFGRDTTTQRQAEPEPQTTGRAGSVTPAAHTNSTNPAGPSTVRMPAPTPDPDAAGELETVTATGEVISEPLPKSRVDQSSLARNSALMALGTLLSRVLGMVRTSLLAACVGLSLVGDAFTVANTLPNYVYILLSAGVLNAVLIPQMTKAMKHKDGGQDYVDRLLTLALGMMAVVALAATVCSPILVRATSNLHGAAYDLAVLMAFICLPQIAFYGLYTVLGQVLNVRGQFAAFMWAPALANVVQIAGLVWFLLAFGKQTDPATVTAPMLWLLAGSTTLGIVLQGISLIWPLYRGGFRWRPRWGFRGRGFGSASKMLGWTFTALCIAQLGGFAINWIMTTVRGDDPTIPSVFAQAQAFQIFMLPHSFITVSILTALFPAMSRAFQDADLDGMRDLVRRGLSLPAVGVIPMSVAMIVLAYPGSRVLFFKLPPHEAANIAWILAAMAIGTMAFGITTLQQRYCFAREDGRLNLWLQGLLTLIQVAIGLCAFLVPPQWAVVTIGLGQSIANIVAGLAFVVLAERQIHAIGLGQVVWLYLRLTVISALAGALTWVLVQGIGRLGDTLLIALGQLVIGGLLFLGLCAVGMRVLRVREFDDLVRPITRRLRRA